MVSTLNNANTLWPTVAPRRRIVRMFVTDSDGDLPVTNCVLMSGAEKITDATDDELWLAADLPALIEAHNQFRKGLGLEPIRLRDLQRAIATIITI